MYLYPEHLKPTSGTSAVLLAERALAARSPALHPSSERKGCWHQPWHKADSFITMCKSYLLKNQKRWLLPPVSAWRLKALHKFLHPIPGKADSLPFNRSSALGQKWKGFRRLTWWLQSEQQSYLELITLRWQWIGRNRQLFCFTMRKIRKSAGVEQGV